MIVNLTPHPLRIYPNDCPDRIEEGAVEPLFTVAPTGSVARIEETTLGTWFSDCFDGQCERDGPDLLRRAARRGAGRVRPPRPARAVPRRAQHVRDGARLPAVGAAVLTYTEADVEALALVIHDARERGIWHGNYTLARWILDHWSPAKSGIEKKETNHG